MLLDVPVVLLALDDLPLVLCAFSVLVAMVYMCRPEVVVLPGDLQVVDVEVLPCSTCVAGCSCLAA